MLGVTPSETVESHCHREINTEIDEPMVQLNRRQFPMWSLSLRPLLFTALKLPFVNTTSVAWGNTQTKKYLEGKLLCMLQESETKYVECCQAMKEEETVNRERHSSSFGCRDHSFQGGRSHRNETSCSQCWKRKCSGSCAYFNLWEVVSKL